MLSAPSCLLTCTGWLATLHADEAYTVPGCIFVCLHASTGNTHAVNCTKYVTKLASPHPDSAPHMRGSQPIAGIQAA